MHHVCTYVCGQVRSLRRLQWAYGPKSLPKGPRPLGGGEAKNLSTQDLESGPPCMLPKSSKKHDSANQNSNEIKQPSTYIYI